MLDTKRPQSEQQHYKLRNTTNDTNTTNTANGASMKRPVSMSAVRRGGGGGVLYPAKLRQRNPANRKRSFLVRVSDEEKRGSSTRACLAQSRDLRYRGPGELQGGLQGRKEEKSKKQPELEPRKEGLLYYHYFLLLFVFSVNI